MSVSPQASSSGAVEVALDSLTAVILNWNQPELTLRSAGSLIADGVPEHRIVVVDNASSDGSWDRFRSSLRGCHLVRLSENVGFARGNNSGAGVLPGACFLFVNSDAFVHRAGSVVALLAGLGSGAGVAVPRLLNEDLTLQPSVVPAPTPGVALARASGLSRLVPNNRQPDWGVRWEHASSRDVQGAIGAVLAVRCELWERLGGFRETVFMYAEDLDLCWRAREHGSRVRFVADAEFVHLGRGSTSWDQGARAERVGRAEAAMIREHLPRVEATLTLAVLRAGYVARFAYRRLAGDRDAATECAGLARGYGAPAAYSNAMTGAAAQLEITVLRPGAEAEEPLPGRDAG